MEYTSELLDRSTGEMKVVSLGDWVTITELGELFGAGRRETRSILREMDFLHVEGSSSHQRHRLSHWVTDRGWGRRIERKHSVPFDVVGPEGRAWVLERWSATVSKLADSRSEPVQEAKSALDAFRDARNQYRSKCGREPMSVEEMVSWLVDHFVTLTQTEIATIVDVTQQIVSRHIGKRDAHRKLLREKRSRGPVATFSE